MTQLCRGLTLAIALVASSSAGCIPVRSTMPTTTWSAHDKKATCVGTAPERDVGRWDDEDRLALEAALQRRGPVVVSALGCELEVLARCAAPGRYQEADVAARPFRDATLHARIDLVEASPLATALEGDCATATHVVSSVDLGWRGGPPVGSDEDAQAIDRLEEEMAAHVAAEGPTIEDPLLRTFIYQPLRVALAPLSLDDYDLTGIWTGVERQPGMSYEVWDVTLSLTHKGGRVTGVSRIEAIDGRSWVEMHFEGRLEGNVLFWMDARTIRHQTDVDGHYGWCSRNGFLIIDPRRGRVVGPWRAPACKPGTMELTRQSPR